MTWHSLSFMPNNMSCLCSICSEICGFSRAHKLAAGPKILSGCCKWVARILNSKMWSHFEPSYSGCKLCHVKACACAELWRLGCSLLPVLQCAQHQWPRRVICAIPSSASFRQPWYSQPGLSTLVNRHTKAKHGCYRWYKRLHPSNTPLNNNLEEKKAVEQFAVKTAASNTVNNRKTHIHYSHSPWSLSQIYNALLQELMSSTSQKYQKESMAHSGSYPNIWKTL